MMKKLVVSFLLCCFLGFSGNVAFGEEDLQEYTDLTGRTVTCPPKVERALFKGPGALRMAVYLGVADRAVGAEQIEKTGFGRPYRMAHEQLGNLPYFAKGGAGEINSMPNLEKVLSLNPQIIFATYMERAKAERLQELLGIPVVILSYGKDKTINKDFLASLFLMGKICGVSPRASEVKDFIDHTMEDLEKRISHHKALTESVYVGGIGYRGSHGIESTLGAYLPFDLLQANSLVSKHLTPKGSIMVDKEQLLLWNPDVIFIDAGGEKLVREDMVEKPEFYKGLRAFQKNRVYRLFPFNYYTTNIETSLVDAYGVGKVLYPEAFKDVNLKTKGDEIFSFFVGKPLFRKLEATFGPLGPMDFTR